MKVLLAQPRGICAGVERAIEIVELALDKFGPPIYVRHEIVHNRHVVSRLAAKGVVFVEDTNEVPDGSVIIFSAHGVSKAVEDHANDRKLTVIDATCPLVSKVHTEGQRYARTGYEIIMVGHQGHPEIEGTLGRVDTNVHLISTVDDVEKVEVNDPNKLAYITQTTLSVDDTKIIIDALKDRFPNIVGPTIRDICYATQNRQSAVLDLAKHVDLVLVVGAHNSSNSSRLRDRAEEVGVEAHLIEDASQLDPTWLDGKKMVGITAGASAPEDLVAGLIERLKELADVEEVAVNPGTEENVHFRLPISLTKPDSRKAGQTTEE